jgi:transposase InsO family protein
MTHLCVSDTLKRKKRKLREYNPENLENALRDVKAGKMSQTRASQVYGVLLSVHAVNTAIKI